MNGIVERTEMLVPEPARALGALLGVNVPDFEHGETLPLLWHWVYLLDRPAQADLGPDGHPVNSITNPGTGRRRMWAGGRIRTSGSLRCGESATKQTRLLSVQEKLGRSGPLTFFIVEHKILQRGRVVIDEQQDIVYRESASPSGQLPLLAGDEPAVPPAAGEWAIEISPTLLFRFSALTYNAHRIHYDRDYARDVEGYPGLLTHGPLQALAMAEAARTMESRRDGQHGDRCFDYRLTSPLFDHQGLIVSATQDQGVTAMTVRDIYGRQTAAATLGG